MDRVRSVTGDLPTVAEAVERLRLAEARLERRRQATAEPSPIERAALRFVFDRADAGDPATPTDLAEHLGMSRSAVTDLVLRFRAQGLVATHPHPDDGRSKILLPVDRNDHLDGDDDLTDAIRSMARELDGAEAAVIVRFLDRLSELVDVRSERIDDASRRGRRRSS